jgi:Pyruvate/2-oxoacid:ferredoxin oxidoreductase delta subunit
MCPGVQNWYIHQEFVTRNNTKGSKNFNTTNRVYNKEANCHQCGLMCPMMMIESNHYTETLKGCIYTANFAFIVSQNAERGFQPCYNFHVCDEF